MQVHTTCVYTGANCTCIHSPTEAGIKYALTYLHASFSVTSQDSFEQPWTFLGYVLCNIYEAGSEPKLACTHSIQMFMYVTTANITLLY